MADLKVTILNSEDVEYWDEQSQSTVVNHKAKYYFVDGLGRYVYVHTRDIKLVIQYIKDNYDGKYTVRTAKQSAGKGSYTCTGQQTRKGQKKY